MHAHFIYQKSKQQYKRFETKPIMHTSLCDCATAADEIIAFYSLSLHTTLFITVRISQHVLHVVYNTAYHMHRTCVHISYIKTSKVETSKQQYKRFKTKQIMHTRLCDCANRGI